MTEIQRWDRYSVESLVAGGHDAQGRLFLSALGQENLQDVRVLHSGLDTVKQLYRGALDAVMLEEVKRVYSEGFGECLEVAGVVWMVGSGGQSGYQYRLQNQDLGLILFLKSRHAEADDKEGSHFKIEASPHWIHPRGAEDMAREFERFAAPFFQGRPDSAGVSVHLCVDVQGWAPPANFQDVLVTRARRAAAFDGGNVVYMNMGEMASTFNRRETYTFGSVSTVQFSCYRKDLQAKKTDKLHFWGDIWRSAPGESFDMPAYDPEKPVWRLELRYHQSVLHDFGRGVAQGMEYGFSLESKNWSSIQGVAKHLQGLWAYGLNSFRLERRQGKAGKRHYDPMWQFLLDDVQFAEPVQDVLYKRVKKVPGLGNEKNLMLAVGNMLSVYARNRFSVKQAWAFIKTSGIYDDLYNYFERRAWAACVPFSESDIFDFVSKGISLRILRGKAA